MNIKTKIKSLIQKKNLFSYSLLSDHLINNFSYVTKKEYLTSCALNCKEPGISETRYSNNEIIVSLTTFGNRFYGVYLAIESIMQQTIKPNRIVLWIGNEFKKQNTPVFLSNQIKRGLEIKYCKDIRSYTKLIPSLVAFPSSTIITIDDDVLYYPDLIENLVNEHKLFPNFVLCARMHLIKLLNNKKCAKYSKWKIGCDSLDISPLNFPTGVGGILYPPGSFNSEVLNENVFLDICPYADDIWFKAMSLYNDVISKKINTHNDIGPGFFNHELDAGLGSINVAMGMNNVQFKAVFDKYNLYEKLIK